MRVASEKVDQLVIELPTFFVVMVLTIFAAGMRYELMLSFTKRDTRFQPQMQPCGGRLVFT